jgi:hypothetical protein
MSRNEVIRLEHGSHPGGLGSSYIVERTVPDEDGGLGFHS